MKKWSLWILFIFGLAGGLFLFYTWIVPAHPMGGGQPPVSALIWMEIPFIVLLLFVCYKFYSLSKVVTLGNK
jgi:hypothetical protein